MSDDFALERSCLDPSAKLLAFDNNHFVDLLIDEFELQLDSFAQQLLHLSLY